MHHMHNFYRFIFFLIFLVNFTSAVRAQDDIDAWRDPTNPQLYSPTFNDKRILEKRIRTEYAKLQAAIKKRDAAVPKNLPMKVIKHIQRDEGIEFPTKDQLLEGGIMDPKAQQKIIAAAFDFYTKQNAKPLQAELAIFTKCTQPKRTKATDYDAGANKPAVILADLLFLAKDDADDMDLSAFGDQTRTFVIDKNKSNPADSFAHSLGVSCLPTRLLSTNRAKYVLEGTEALKNYDKSPEGNGEMPEYLKPRFEKKGKK